MAEAKHRTCADVAGGTLRAAKLGGIRAALWRCRTWLHLPGIAAALWLSHPTTATVLWALPLIVVGMGLRTWALGHIRKDQALCTSGPYSLMRHPLYAANFVILAGLLIMANSRALAVVAVPLCAAHYWAIIKHEEAWLARRFPEEWARYVRDVPMLVPRLARPIGHFDSRLALANRAIQNWVLLGITAALIGGKPFLVRLLGF